MTVQRFELREFAPGWSPKQIQERTEAKLVIAADLRAFRFRDEG